MEFKKPGVIFLCTGLLEDDSPYWAYVMIPHDNIEAYQKAKLQGNFALQDYGTVIAWGKGEQPPEDIQKEMAQTYDIQHNMPETFLNELGKHPEGQKIIKEFKDKLPKA